MTTGRINQVSTSARAPPQPTGVELQRVRLGVRELRRNRELTDADPKAGVPTVVSTTLHQTNGTSGRTRRGARPKHRRLRSTGPRRTHALRRRYQWGCPSGYAYVFPLGGPRRTSRRRTRFKRQGPAKQPSTTAPELLPDREANVNSKSEGRALGSRPPRRTRQPSWFGDSPNPAGPTLRARTTLPPFLIAPIGATSTPARNCETRYGRKFR